MNELETFVHARLADGDLPPETLRAYQRIAAVAREIRAAGVRSDERSWLTGATPVVKLGEYLLGADSSTESAQFGDQLLAILANMWTEHADYDATWSGLLPAPR